MEIIDTIDTKQMMQDFKQIESAKNDVCTVILKVDNKNFGSKIVPYKIKLMGKTMLEWCENAVFDTKACYADYMFGQDFLSIVKNVTDVNCKYTFVLFSDTPLFQHKTFLQVLDYFKFKDLSVLKLTRGYLFKTEYLLKIDSLLSPQTEYFEEEDFITCYNLKQTAMVNEILKNRVLDYFMKNGVIIEDPSSAFIDADCQIGEGTIIKPFNQIKGKTIIEKNVVINSFCEIEDSIICENANIAKSCITKSYIGSNAKICANCVIQNNAKVCENVIVPQFCNICGVKINKEQNLKSFCIYKAE